MTRKWGKRRVYCGSMVLPGRPSPLLSERPSLGREADLSCPTADLSACVNGSTAGVISYKANIDSSMSCGGLCKADKSAVGRDKSASLPDLPASLGRRTWLCQR